MNELKVTPIPKSVIVQLSTPERLPRRDESFAPVGTVDEHKLLPLHENKLVAEKTKDMFFGGEMCE